MFASYGARFVYGNKCYKFEHTQEPWIEKKMHDYRMKLLDEINDK